MKAVTQNTGARNDTTNRTAIEAAWPMNGIVSRNVADRQYDVQEFTGVAYSNVQGAQFDRGKFYRYGSPSFQPAPPVPMYDPTKP